MQTWDSQSSKNLSVHYPFFTAAHQARSVKESQILSLRDHRKSKVNVNREEKPISGQLIKQQGWSSSLTHLELTVLQEICNPEVSEASGKTSTDTEIYGGHQFALTVSGAAGGERCDQECEQPPPLPHPTKWSGYLARETQMTLE